MFEPMFAEASAEGRAGAMQLKFAKTSSNFFKDQLTKGVSNKSAGGANSGKFRKSRIKALFIVCGKMPD